MTQASEFYNGEGDAWLKRNVMRLPTKNDLILSAFDQLVGGLGKDSSVLEIGCSNGWRLEEIRARYGCTRLLGVDPSEYAVKEVKKRNIRAVRGTALDVGALQERYDVVIFGFCLYLCDRDHLFHIISAADHALEDGGLMVVYDFTAVLPHKTEYKHKQGIWSYKQNYEEMFLCSPAYTKLLTVYHKDGQTKATLLRKDVERGWPCELVS